MNNIEKGSRKSEEQISQQEIETPAQEVAPDMEGFERRQVESEKRDADKIERVLEKLREVGETPKEKVPEKYDKFSFGDFQDTKLNEKGKIALSQADNEKVAEEAGRIKAKHRFSMPSLFTGSRTATEYDSRVGNFSTRTNIITLEDGKKVFAVYNYPTSWIHRALDGASKHLAGDRMAKANSSDWKRTFESRSNIPIIECEDENIVLMPFIQNINGHDLFARNKEIKDFGQCQFAKDIDLDGKMQIAERIVAEIQAVHQKGKTWGETILPNIIVTPEGKPITVDPETQYDKDVPAAEQRARDIRDVVMSICGALKYSEKIDDYKPVVDRLLSQYADKGVVEELKRVVSVKPTGIKKLMRGSYEAARLGINPAEYQKVADAILAYNASKTEG